MEAFEIATGEGIATVTLRGPGKGNAMGPAFWRECPAVFAALDADPEVRVVLVRGSGGAFSYGLDLLAMGGELAPLFVPTAGPTERARLLAVIRELQASHDAVFRCRKPVLAAVHGWCIGAGLDLVSACDYRMCSADARFSLREVKVGMVADVGSLQRLPHLIGEGATRELAFTGKDIDAPRALALGLVSAVLPTADELFAAARAEAATIAANSPLVVQGIKQVMNARVARQIAEGLETVAAWNTAFLPSEDLLEAMAAFAGRRPAVYRGR